MDTENVKSFIQSKTIQGIALMLAGFIGSRLNITITEFDVSGITANLCDIITAIGTIYATYGRISATKKIK